MSAFLASVIAMVGIGVGAWGLLTQEFDFSSAHVFQSQHQSVRLDPEMGSPAHADE